MDVYKTSGKLSYKGDFLNGVVSHTCAASNVSYAFRSECKFTLTNTVGCVPEATVFCFQ